MKEAKFKQPSILPFAAPMVCVIKAYVGITITIYFQIINKNLIENYICCIV